MKNERKTKKRKTQNVRKTIEKRRKTWEHIRHTLETKRYKNVRNTRETNKNKSEKHRKTITNGNTEKHMIKSENTSENKTQEKYIKNEI